MLLQFFVWLFFATVIYETLFMYGKSLSFLRKDKLSVTVPAFNLFLFILFQSQVSRPHILMMNILGLSGSFFSR